MDPNETLRRIRWALAALDGLDPGVNTEEWARAGDELAEYVEALDGWLTNGGFPPDAWVRHNVVD